MCGKHSASFHLFALRKILSPGTIFARAVCIRVAISKYRETTEISDEDVRPRQKNTLTTLRSCPKVGGHTFQMSHKNTRKQTPKQQEQRIEN